jgi:hypothetical protein
VVEEWHFPIQPGLGHAQKLSEARDDRDLRGIHREEASEDDVEQNKRDDRQR